MEPVSSKICNKKIKDFFDENYVNISKALVSSKSPYVYERNDRLKALMRDKKTFMKFKLFFLNEMLEYRHLTETFAESEIDALKESEFISVNGKKVFSNFFVLPLKRIIFSDSFIRNNEQNFVYTSIESMKFLQFISKYNLKNNYILDVGTGPGTYSIEIDGAKGIVGCDINKRAILFAKINQNFHKRKGVSFVHKNYLDLIGRNKFDTIICNPPYIPYSKSTWLVFRHGGKTGFEFSKKLIEKFLSSDAKQLFMIVLSGMIDEKLLIEEMLKKSGNIGYEIEVLEKIWPYSILLKTADKKEMQRVLTKNNISYFCYCFIAINKNSDKKSVVFKYKDSSIGNFLNESASKIFPLFPSSIALSFINSYNFSKKKLKDFLFDS